MGEVPPTLLWWGAGLGLGLAGISAFVAWHGPGLRRRNRRTRPPGPPPKAPVAAPAELKGTFGPLSDRPDRDLDEALRLWAARAAASGCRVFVEASADASGSPTANRRLVAGRARAAVVRLRQAGVPPESVKVIHRSPQPAADETGRRLLRYVRVWAE